jgi:hypothetical protein
MTKIKAYLTNPAVRVSFWVFLVWIGVTRWTLNFRVNLLEQKSSEIDTIKVQYYDIQTKLAEIQTNLSWIMSNMK